MRLALLALVACSRSEPEVAASVGGKVEIVETPASGDLVTYVAGEVKRGEADRVPVLVYVGATWCEPCKELHAAAMAGKLDASAPACTTRASGLEDLRSCIGVHDDLAGALWKISPLDGLALGIADDLANDALAQLTATGLLNLNLKKAGAEFTTAKITATMPPVIAADGTDGKLRVIVPDLMVTFLDQDQPVSRVATVNAEIPISITPTADGSSIAVDLGTPAIAIDTLDDLTGLTMPPESDFARTITLGAEAQTGSILGVLKNIPLPTLGGITLSDASVGGESGYVLARIKIQ